MVVTTSTNGHLCDHGTPAFGPLAEHGPLEQATGAQPTGGDPVAVDEARLGEPVGDRDVVGEGVLLVLEMARRATTVGRPRPRRGCAWREHDAGVEQARSAGSQAGSSQAS